MSETSRVSIGAVKRRVAKVMDHYRTRAAHDKAVKQFLAPRSRRDSARKPKGVEPIAPVHRIYMQNEDYLAQHGEEGRNIIKKGEAKGKRSEP